MNEHGTQRSPESLSEADREAANSIYDRRQTRHPGHELGLPNFARLRAELSDEELSERIWEHHRKEQNQ